jgi:hypothetical protein
MGEPARDRARRFVAWTALVIGVPCLLWASVLLVHGGFDGTVAGVRVTSHDPFRPAALGLVALVIATIAGGVARSLAVVKMIWDDRLAAALMALAVTIAGLVCGTKAAGGSDSYGYLSEAELWLSGRLTVSQPWVQQIPWPGAEVSFSPLAYHPIQPAGTLAPVYSPGLPMLMALAKLVAGPCAVFWITPLAGGALVLATYGIGRRFGSSSLGLVAAWFVATSPAFLFMQVVPMSDVPAAGAWAVAFWFALGDTVALAVAGGVAAAIAVLIRPNLAPMVLAIAAWLAYQRWRAPDAKRRSRTWQTVGFLLALAPGVVTEALLNQHWNGSALRSGYGALGDLFAWENIPKNLHNYTAWFSSTQTPFALLGVVALFVPARWLWPSGTSRAGVVVGALFSLGVFAEYCLYMPFDAWWYLRFLLPCWPFVMLGLAAVFLRPMRSGRALAALFTITAVLVLGGYELRLAIGNGSLDQSRGESKYPAMGKLVRERTDTNAVMLSGQHSGSLRYYSGRMTLTFFSLDEEWLDRAVAWLSEHGAHPYAVLESWEVKDFQARFAPHGPMGRLEMTPMVEYDGPAKIYVFDLLRSPQATDQMERIVDSPSDVRCTPPGPTPRLVLK